MEAARLRDMRFILMKQEVAGAMLASTWGEITGSPGVCLSTRGPGAANMVNGIAHAFLDRAPLIAAISGARSRKACAMPLTMFAAPGPRVERQTPGEPVISPPSRPTWRRRPPAS